MLAEDDIIKINQIVCSESKSPCAVNKKEMISSALHGAFYPGNYPFRYGGVAKMAGALWWKIAKNHPFKDGNKRTALLSSEIFLNLNGFRLKYPLKSDAKPFQVKDTFAELVENICDEKINTTIDQTINWFDRHKILKK